MKRFLRSHIGRTLDPAHASNRYVVAAAVLGGAVVAGVRLAAGEGDVLRWGFFGGAAAFIAWVIGRELDPDDTVAAGIAAPLAVLALFTGEPGLGAGAAVIIALRIVIRSTGRSPTTLDLVLLLGAAAYLGTRAEAWVPLAGLIAAVAYDGAVTRSGAARRFAAPAGIAAAGLVAALLATPEASWTTPDGPAWALLGIGTLAGLLGLGVRPPVSVGDLTGVALEHDRLKATRWFAIAIGLGSFAVLGGDGIAVVGPLWAAEVGMLVAAVRQRITRRSAPTKV